MAAWRIKNHPVMRQGRFVSAHKTYVPFFSTSTFPSFNFIQKHCGGRDREPVVVHMQQLKAEPIQMRCLPMKPCPFQQRQCAFAA
jgi:hypothetical protein